MAVTKIRSKWVAGLLEFFGITAGTTVLKITESGIEADVTGNVTGNVAGNVAGYAFKSAALTANADGTGAAVIPVGVTHVTVTSSANTKVFSLPPPVVGTRIVVIMTANGAKIKTSAPATVGINGGVGEAATLAIAANIEVIFECMSATSWKAWTVADIGTFAAAAAAS